MHAARTNCKSSDPSDGMDTMACSKIRYCPICSAFHCHAIEKQLTSSVSTVGQKPVKFRGDNRHKSTRMHKNTSLCTTGDDTVLRTSTSFSIIVGSCVKNWFLSPANNTNDNRRTFNDLRSISYSRFANIFADGAAATFPVICISRDYQH